MLAAQSIYHHLQRMSSINLIAAVGSNEQQVALLVACQQYLNQPQRCGVCPLQII